MAAENPKLKMKQFPSKYPFKQESRSKKEIIYEGHIDELPLPLSEELHKDHALKEETKFIIVYTDAN